MGIYSGNDKEFKFESSPYKFITLAKLFYR
jgi:hypothetical protein